MGRVHQPTIDPAGKGGAGEALTDVGSKLTHGYGVSKGAARTVGEGDLGHGPCACSVVIDTRDHVIQHMANNSGPAAETK